MVNGTPAYQQTTADGTFPPKAFTQTPAYTFPVTLTKSDCEQKLKEAYEEIERLRAEVARLQGEVDFLRGGGVATALNRAIYGDAFRPPKLHGDGP